MPDNPCGFAVGDIATTKVLINKERQLTNYYCSEQADTPYQVVECFFTDEDISSQECPDDFGASSSLLDLELLFITRHS